MKVMGANHCRDSQCPCLSLQMEFMTNECFDCSTSLKYLTGFQVLGAITSQSLSSLLVPFHLLKPASAFAHSSIIFLRLPQQKGYQEVNPCGFIPVPPSWDRTGQHNTAGQSHLTSEGSTLQMKDDENFTHCLERPPRRHSPHTVLENGISSASQR